MTHIFIVSFILVAFQAVCESAPGPKDSEPPLHDVDVGMEEKHVEKRAWCSDKKKSCTWWKQQGYCDKRSKYNPYMMKNCKVSCGNCGGCSDKTKSCTWWKQQGYCDKRSKYNPYMMNNCKLSCGNCGGCSDKKKSCAWWKQQGYCDKRSKYNPYMMNNCKLSCGNCEGRKTTSSNSAIDRDKCLQAHNEKRARHEASPLVWDDTLAQHAQAWANHLLRTGSFVHARGTGEGENLALGYRTCVDAMTGWYDKEEPLYNYNNPGFSLKTGHFTQVVWKATRRVGVALASNEGKNIFYIVARYSPPGNVIGQFSENVGRKAF